MGRCTGFAVQRGAFNGRGYGRGSGFGRGCGQRLHLHRRCGYGATYGRDERETLEGEAAYLEEQLRRTRKQLDALQGEQS